MTFIASAGGIKRLLADVPDDTPVRLIPAKSSGVSDYPRMYVSDGHKSKYGYFLPNAIYGEPRDEDDEPTKTVLWIK